MVLIFQVHVLSALMLVMMYIPFYLYTFVKVSVTKKKETFVQVVIAVILFLLLTVNVWLVLLYLRGTNHLLDPFINREIGKNGIDGTARYWLYTPISLMVLLVLQFVYAILNWRKLAKWKKILHWHCTLIMGHKKNTFMRPVFCTLQETDHLIFVEF